MIPIIVFLILFCLSLWNDNPNVCLTPKCKSISKEISQLMDIEVNPCEDFNKFACGGFERTSVLNSPDDVKQTIQIPRKELYNRVKKLLEEDGDSFDEFETDSKVRKFYKSCQNNKNTIDFHSWRENWTKFYSKRLKTYIETKLRNVGLSDWPYSDNSKLNYTFRWFDVVPKLIAEGLVYTDGVLEFPIMNVEVGVDDFDRKIYTLKVDAPDFDIDHENNGKDLCTKGKNRQVCEVNFKEIMEELNPNEDSLNHRMLERSLEIDREIYKTTRLHSIFQALKNAGHDSKYFKDKRYRDYPHPDVAEFFQYNQTTMCNFHDMPCGTIDQSCQPITPTKYFQSLFDASDNSHIEIRNNCKVIVKDPKYFSSLRKTIGDLNLKAFEMANYMGWKLVSDVFVFVKNVEHEFEGDCVKFLMEARSRNHRAEHGVLNGAVGSMYVRKYFKPEWKLQVQKMVSYIKSTAKIFFQKSDMFSDSSKKKAIEKLEAMKEYVAYPEQLLSKSAIDGYYKDLVMTDDQKDNWSNVAKFYIKKSFGRLGKIWNNDFWDLEEHQIVNTVNALYFLLVNEFVITAGFLQDFNYSFDHPMYLNFAITGYTIGHEIFHGFDNSGMLHDKNGKSIEQPGLMSNETNRKWKKYENCLSNQYSVLKVNQLSNELYVNGKQTLGENLADVGGIQLAYHAYEFWTNDFGEENVLPSLNFTQKQLFWIRSAQLHCSKFGDNALKYWLGNAAYPPGGLRTNGMLMFSNQFAKDFNCPKNSPMNPRKKCGVDDMWPEYISSSP